MKNLIIVILILFISQCYADIACLKISGSFDASIEIWKSRWYQYNGSILEISSNQIKSVYGYYIEDGKINGLKYWKQIGGDNAIWFGDRCNPLNSYDTWYIGNPNCVSVPANRKSIPRIPTFIPNILEYGNRNFNILDRPAKNGYPTIESIILTEEELTNLVNSISIAFLDEPLFIDSINIINNDVNLWWRDKDTNCSYKVMRSFDLINWEESSIEIKSLGVSNKSNHYSEMRDSLNIMPTSMVLKTNKNKSIFFKLIKKKTMH